MSKGKKGGCSPGERMEVTELALLPAALGQTAPLAALAGRLSWLAPVLALPVGLCLGPVWNRLGKRDLGEGLTEAFGGLPGKLVSALYLLWALVLIADASYRYSERLLTVYEGERVRWLFLLTALGLCLWLSRGRGKVFLRMGYCFFPAVGVTLGIVLLLALPGVDWRNLWPPERADWRGLPGAAARCLSLTGCGVYVLCLPGREGEKKGGTRARTALGCAALAALQFIIAGVFGPALTAEMGDPFLYLMEGVQVPGAFRRGEAGLIALLALGDLALLTLLSRGATVLLGRLSARLSGVGWLPVGAAFFGGGILPRLGRVRAGLSAALPGGNLIFGILLPVLSVLTIQAREG